jgi:Fe-S cluster assembly protein SufD
VEIQTLAEATATDIHWAREVFGQLEAAGQRPVARPFAAFNTAFAGDGMVLRVTCRAPRPLAFVYLHEDPRSDALLRHLIRLEPGAELTLLESGPGAARLNAVAEVDVAAGAAFHHLRVQGPDEERRSVVHLFARVAEGAVFKSFTLTANGALTRNETVVDLAGPRAVVHIAGAGLGDAGYHHDDTVFLTHSAPDCESRQVFKNVLRNGATGVFQGKILVAQAAQRTDGYQIAQGLMLDGDSQFLAKPELEIYADDVKCSHGSTVGAIDPVALFYLTSRGVPRRVAQDMLVLAFAAEALEEIEDEALRAATEALLQDWLAGHSGR